MLKVTLTYVYVDKKIDLDAPIHSPIMLSKVGFPVINTEYFIFQDQTEMIHQLTCPEISNNKISTKTESSTPYSTNAIKLATKPWSWASNTIDTGDFGPPTRHRRETEDMLSTTGEFSITKESSTTTKPKNVQTKTTKQPEQTNTPIKSTTTEPSKPTTQKEIKVTTPKIEKTTQSTPIIAVQNKTPSTQSPEKETSDFPSINQGVLFNLPENGTVFDIIEVNDNLTDYSEKRKENHKLLEDFTTTAKPTTKISTTEIPIYTTISFYKEAPSRGASVVPLTSTNKENITGHSQEQTNITENKKDLTTSAEQEKTFMRAIENNSNSLVKLNRTSRKELPLLDFNITSEEKDSLSLEDKVVTTSASSKEIIEDNHDHRVVEITLMHHDNKDKEKGKLIVTTKKHEKLIKMRKEKTKMDTTKGKNFLDKNVKTEKSLKPDEPNDKTLASEVHSLLQNKTQPEIKFIDPKLVDLNFNKSKNNNSEKVPIKIQAAQPTTTENSYSNKEEINTEFDDYAKELEVSNPLKTTPEDPVEPEPEAQPRPNRNRVLTRPQRRSFYPYFFSRVLG